jgi:hypothetical protein
MSKSRNNALEFSTVGSEVLESTDAVTGKRYGALQVINDSVFSVLTAGNLTDGSKLIGQTILAGTVLYGEFSAVSVSTGLVIAHKY